MTDAWKEKVFRRINKSRSRMPDDFDGWLNERLNMKTQNGKYYLTEREREVYELRIVQGLTVQSVADELGVSKQYANQVEWSLIRKLRKADILLTREYRYYTDNENVFGLPLPERAEKLLYENNILTIGQLERALQDGSIYDIKKIGKKTISELRWIINDWKITRGRLSE